MRIWSHPLTHFSLTLGILLKVASASALGFFAASADEVQNSQCRYPVLTTLPAIESYFKNKEKDSDKGSFELLGFKFVNESPFYVKLFKDLIETSERTSGQELPTSVALAQKNCNSVRCALATIFGKNESLKALYLLDKYRLNVAPMKYLESGFFKDPDLDLILETMSLVPPHLLPLSDLQQLTHVSPDGEKPENTFAESAIQIFDLWDKEPTGSKKYVLFHELAHNWSSLVAQDLDESEEWLKITGWKKISGGFMIGWEHPFRRKFEGYPWISKYSSANAWEDFAEAVSAYRFTPAKLEKASPARYLFVKTKVFGGIEFKDGRHCQLKNQKQETEKIEYLALELLDKKTSVYNEFTTNIDLVEVQEHLINLCGESLSRSILQKAGAIPEFHACVNKELNNLLAKSYNWLNVDRQAETLKVNFKKAKRRLIHQWLVNSFINQNMESVRWSATKDYDCKVFAKNYQGLLLQSFGTPTVANLKRTTFTKKVAPAIGYWICADAKRKGLRSAQITKDRFNLLKSWLYPRLSLSAPSHLMSSHGE